MQHKWHKEIKAWADGAEIEANNGGAWHPVIEPALSDKCLYRIKPQPSGCLACVTCGQLVEQPQPKEPQYLYVFKITGGNIYLAKDEPTARINGNYIGKIKLEVDDNGYD